jgi:hypothetical protein
MHYRQMKTDRRNLGQLVGVLLLLWGCLSGRANVFASDIKLNGSTNNAAMVPGGLVQISYILNEAATAGLCVEIYAGATVVWSNSLAGGDPGTGAGSNGMAWGGTNQTGASVAAGIYQVSITAAATGYADWTNITDDSAKYQVLDPSGIAVNKNTNSPYYGRVFVGSATDDGSAGVYKFNPDGSPADEGGFSQSYPWPGGNYYPGYLYSPWKMDIAEDDVVYINDWSGQGLVLAFDEVLSTNYLTVLDANNYNSFEQLSGPCVTGGGSNTRIWMADANTNSSMGVLRWDVTDNGAVGASDPGTVMVGISPNGLNLDAYDVSVDGSGNIYVIQLLDGHKNPGLYSMPRVFRFPPYRGQTDFDPTWRVGSADYSLENAAGVAVDPTGRFVAVAVRGYDTDGNSFDLANGAVNLYNAADGGLVTRLRTDAVHDEYIDAAWDNVGNLYATAFSAAVWRAYSPPGANQATTTAVPIIQVYDSLTRPWLGAPVAPVAPATQFGFTLLGQSNVTYVIECSPDLVNWTPIATNYDIVPVRAVTVPLAGDTSFFQAVVP